MVQKSPKVCYYCGSLSQGSENFSGYYAKIISGKMLLPHKFSNIDKAFGNPLLKSMFLHFFQNLFLRRSIL